MDEKTLQALTTLATKLGVTAEYLWSVLLKQAPISGAINLLVCAAWIVGVYAWARFVYCSTAVPEPTADNRYPKPIWTDDVAHALGWISVVVSVFVVTLIVGLYLPLIAAALFNPEHWALQQILK